MAKSIGSELRRNLHCIACDGFFYSVMVGLGETYLPAFVLALSMGAVSAGLVAAIPLLTGSLIQMVSPRGVLLLGSHRRWVVLCATLQALSFLPLIVAALAGQAPKWFIFSLASLYWASSLGTTAAWNTWVGTFIPRRIRPTYFGRRSRLTQLATLCGLLLGGVILQAGKDQGLLLPAFALIFLLAATARFISSSFLFRQTEPTPIPANYRNVPMLEVLRGVLSRHEKSGRSLLLYLLLVQVAIQISVPYFTPFMLTQLHLSYVHYMLLISLSYVTKIVLMPTMGKLAYRFGARRLLFLGGIGMIPLPGLWMVSDSFGYLCCLQVLAGIFWGSYDVAILLLFFDTIREEERTSVLTTFNLINSIAMMTGAAIGGLILSQANANLYAYHAVFALSLLCRACTVFFLKRLPDVRPEGGWVATQTMGVHPSNDSMERPVLTALPRPRPSVSMKSDRKPNDH